jgi:methionyl-tRNA formyltransferase
MNGSISIIISNNIRSLEYLDIFIKLKKEPNKVIYIDDNKSLLIKKKIKKILFLEKIFKNKKTFYSKKLSNQVIKYLLKDKEKNFILSLPHGEIIKNSKLLKSKNLIHFHPGKLPLFRGATSIYYSLLRKKEIGCSTIIMSSDLDGGNLLFDKKFSFPKKTKDIDKKYDIEIRKICLEYLLKNFKKLEPKPQKKINKLHYYLAHPIIRKLAVMKMKS